MIQPCPCTECELARLGNEIDRLRAENAELRRGVQLAIDADMSYIDDEAVREELRSILAKTAKEGD